MNYRFSKLSKTIIIINIVLTLTVAVIHGYNIHRIEVTNEKIYKFMEEKNVTRYTAIRMLEREGEKLFINQEFTTYFGMFMCILTLILLYKFLKSHGFFFGFFAAFGSFVTSFVGGLLLFYVIFSKKSEIKRKIKRYSLKDEWERYIHEKVIIIDNTEDKV